MAENKSDDGGEIVSNVNAKTPVCKYFGFPGNGEGMGRLFVVSVQKKYLIRTIPPTCMCILSDTIKKQVASCHVTCSKQRDP